MSALQASKESSAAIGPTFTTSSFPFVPIVIFLYALISFNASSDFRDEDDA